MTQGYDGLPDYYFESSDPLTPNLGLSLKGMDPIVAYDMVLIDTAVGGGGSTVRVNGTPITNPNFNDTTPPHLSGHPAILWQFDGSGNVSAYGMLMQVDGNLSTSVFNNKLNLESGSGVGISDTGSGNIQFNFTAQLFSIDGVSTISSFLNFVTGTGITITDNGGGDVRFDVSASLIEINGTPISAVPVNIQGTATISVSDTGGGNIQFDLIPALPQNTPATAGQALASYNSGTGAFTKINVGSGTVTSVAMTGDGVIFNSTVTGSPVTTSGTLIPVLLTQTANRVLAGPTSGGAVTPTFRALVAADLPAGTGTVTSIAFATGAGASDVLYTISGSPVTTSGTITETLRTQTANFVFVGPTSGGAASPTFRALVAADIPSNTLTPLWNNIASPADNQTLNMGAFFTTWQWGSSFSSQETQWDNAGNLFLQPSFAASTPGATKNSPQFTLAGTYQATSPNVFAYDDWTFQTVVVAGLNGASTLVLSHTGSTGTSSFALAPITNAAATSSTSVSSLICAWQGRLFVSGVDTAENWTVQNVIGTPNNKAITNSSENSSSVVVLTVGSSHGFTVGMWATFTGLTTATWLNNQNAVITSVAATTISFTDPTTHGTSASHADTGTATQIPNSELTFTPSNTVGDTRVILPVTRVGNANTGMGSFAFAGQSAFIGYGPIGLAAGGLAIYQGSGVASQTCIGFYHPNTVPTAGSMTSIVSGIEFGDSSAGNSTSQFQTNAANFSVGLQGSYTTGATQPAVLIGNGGNTFTSTSGNVIGLGMGYTKAASSFNFAPTSGTAIWKAARLQYTVNQTGGANGASFGLEIAATETAVGGTHLLLNLLAGASGTTQEFAINNTGIATFYGATALVSQGMPSEIATVDLTAQSAAIGATNLIASAPRSGMYRIAWSATITTAATTSSVLGGTNGFQVVYTSPTDSVVKTTVAGNSVTSAANTTATGLGDDIVIYAKTGTAIQYKYDYTSVGVTAMVYELHVKLEAM